MVDENQNSELTDKKILEFIEMKYAQNSALLKIIKSLVTDQVSLEELLRSIEKENNEENSINNRSEHGEEI